MDEVQISGMALDTNWVKLSYQSQRRDAAPAVQSLARGVRLHPEYRFNTTRTGANVMADEENFPLLVRITGSTIVDAVQNDWDDIRFLDGDGKTWLNYAVERWGKTADSAEVWVMVPKVDGNSDRDFITLYYNDVIDGAVPDGQCASCVFSTSNDFVAAWNLNTSGTGARANSVSGGNSATPVNYDNDEYKGGMIAGADSLDGAATGDYLSLGTGYADFTGGFTYSVWAYPTNTASYGRLLDIGNGAASNNIALQRAGTGTNLYLEVYNGTTVRGAGHRDRRPGHQCLAAFRGDRGRVRQRPDLQERLRGRHRHQHPVDCQHQPGELLYRPSRTGADAYFQGKIDQPQILDAARDSNWMRLQYETQRATGNLFWNSRPGPNNTSTLTATPGSSGISLTWTTPVSDSSNADSVGIWVKYSGKPDSVGATGQTRVVVLAQDRLRLHLSRHLSHDLLLRPGGAEHQRAMEPLHRRLHRYGAAAGRHHHDGHHLRGLRHRHDDGTHGGSCTKPAIPSTPLTEIEDAVWCAQASGFVPNDTLVIRVVPGPMPGIRQRHSTAPSTYPSSSPPSTRTPGPVLSSADTAPATRRPAGLRNTTLRRMDVRAATNGAAGVRSIDDADSVHHRRLPHLQQRSHQARLRHRPPRQQQRGHPHRQQPHPPALHLRHPHPHGRSHSTSSDNTLIGTGAGSTKGMYMPRTPAARPT